MSDVPNTKEISTYLHCGRCLKQSGDDPYTQDIEVGWTKWGIQVWCRRHNINIVHIDFEGQKHKAAGQIAKPRIVQ